MNCIVLYVLYCFEENICRPPPLSPSRGPVEPEKEKGEAWCDSLLNLTLHQMMISGILENNCEDQRPYSFLLPYKCQQMDPIRILINQIYFISPKLPPTPIQFPLKTSSSWILAPASLENRPIAVSERELTLVILYYCSCNIDLAFAIQHWLCLKIGHIQQTTDFKT